MNTAALLVFALALDAALGEPAWLWKRLPHPAVLMGRLIGALDKHLNTGTRRRLMGVFAVGTSVSFAAVVGVALASLGPAFECLGAAILLAQRSLVDHVAAVAEGLRQSLGAGRTSVAMIVSRDTMDMDASQVARSAIESGAENLSDGVVAPAFWFLLGGLPAMAAYKMVNTADSMIGYRTDRHEAFGWAAARLDDLMNLLPARLTALLIALVAGLRAPVDIRSDARLHRSPNAGWPEAAMSRALGIALAGPRAYDGQLQDFPWVNETGRRTLSAVDIDACLTILWKVWAWVFALCAVIAFFAS